MKNRVLALLLAGMLLVNMAACNNRENPTKEEENTPAQEEVTLPKEEEKTEEKPEEEPVVEVEKPELGDKIAEAKGKNSDVVGWLQIPDTEINAAVVQTTNNNYYYRLNEMKEYSFTGCYWVDYECAMGATSADLMNNTIIYGHNIDYGINVGTKDVDEKDGDRFSQLFHYTDEEWAKEHPYIFFSTPEEDMLWEVFAVAYTNTDFNYIEVLKDRNVSKTEQLTGEQLMKIVNGGKDRSEYDYKDVEVNEDDKILTLSTCSYKYGMRSPHNVRFIVMAKLVTEEDTLVETANISLNEDKIAVQ